MGSATSATTGSGYCLLRTADGPIRDDALAMLSDEEPLKIEEPAWPDPGCSGLKAIRKIGKSGGFGFSIQRVFTSDSASDDSLGLRQRAPTRQWPLRDYSDLRRRKQSSQQRAGKADYSQALARLDDDECC